MTPPLITLIFTKNRLLEHDWRGAITAHLGTTWREQLFFLDQGIHLINQEWPLEAEKIYCASGHQRLQGPKPWANVFPGGLANLGGMIRTSTYTLSIPAIHWPAQPSQNPKKTVAILLQEDSTEVLLEAARLGAGLAGCNHKPILCHPSLASPSFPEAASPYLNAMMTLDGIVKVTPDPHTLTSEHDIILQL